MDLPDPGIEPGSPALQADSLPTELSGKQIADLSFGGLPRWGISVSRHRRELGTSGAVVARSVSAVKGEGCVLVPVRAARWTGKLGPKRSETG